MAKQTSQTKKGKPGILATPGGWVTGMQGFLRDTRGELRKVTWPNRKQIVVSTGVVLATTIIMGLYIGALDVLLTYIIKSIGF